MKTYEIRYRLTDGTVGQQFLHVIAGSEWNAIAKVQNMYPQGVVFDFYVQEVPTA